MATIRGTAVNFRFGSRGYPETATDTDLLGDSIYTILKTIPGERVYRPTFGCNLARLLFGNVTDRLRVRAKIEARVAITTFEKRVIVDDVRIDKVAEANKISVTVIWRPITDQTQIRQTVANFEIGG